MVTIFIPLLVMVIGLLLYGFGTPKLQPIGLHCFWVGLFFVVLNQQHFTSLFARH